MSLILIAILFFATLLFVIIFGTYLLGQVDFLSSRGPFFRGVLAILILAVMGLGYFVITYPTYLWNQKLTVEVETPNGLVRGSSVVGVKVVNHFTFGLTQLSRITHSWRGEAVLVEIGDNQHLFALLGHPAHEARATFKTSILDDPDARRPTFSYAKLARLRQTAPVPRKRYPLLVTFTDINDPSSVQRVDPDDLAAHFGAGVKLKAITLEITNEPVTRGQIEKFEFMSRLKVQATLSGLTMFDKKLPDPINYLTDKAFITRN